MAKKVEKAKVVVTVTLDGEILYLAEVEQTKDPEIAAVSSLVSPYVHLPRICELFRKLAENEATSYFMGRVKLLSEEARDAIEKSLREGNDIDSLPF